MAQSELSIPIGECFTRSGMKGQMTPLRKRMIEDLQLHGCSPATQKAYLGAVGKLACHYHKSPDLISEEELRAFFLHLRNVERCAPGTFKIALSGIKFFFAVTLQRPWPVLGLVRPVRERKLPVVLSKSEVRSILGCVRAPVYRACLSTIYACGLRISEGVALQTSDIDGQRQVLRVRGKGNKDRQVPLSQPTLERLRAFWRLHRQRPWLFPARLQPRAHGQEEGPISADNLRIAFHAALKQSAIPKAATVHSLRHSYATHLLEAKVCLRLIQEVLGHRNPRTTALYTHLTAAVHAQIAEPLRALTQGL
jgi:site-specific recombinase XerD